MILRRIKAIEGKTIETAEQGGSEFEDFDNRILQLRFTDGTTFNLSVSTTLEAEAVLFEKPNSDRLKTLYKR